MSERRRRWRRRMPLLLAVLISAACVTSGVAQRHETASIPTHVAEQLKNQPVRAQAPSDLEPITQAFLRDVGATVVLEGRTSFVMRVELVSERQVEILPFLKINGQTLRAMIVTVQATLIRDDGQTRVIVYQGAGQASYDSGGNSLHARQAAALKALLSLR